MSPRVGERPLEEVVPGIEQRGAGVEGSDYFQFIARALNEALGAERVFVGETLADGQRVRVLAGWGQGQALETRVYDAAGTPCAGVMADEVCVHERRVSEAFPEDRTLVEHGIESYVGVPIPDSDGGVMGLLVALFPEPLINPHKAAALMMFFTKRIAREMLRTRHGEGAHELEPERNAAAETDPGARRGKGLALFVDDDDGVRAVGLQMLKAVGFEALGARGEGEALRVFCESWSLIRLVVLDMTMPKESCWKVLRELRAISPSLSVVLTSGFNHTETIPDLRGDVLPVFLQKPFRLQDMRARVGEALQ